MNKLHEVTLASTANETNSSSSFPQKHAPHKKSNTPTFDNDFVAEGLKAALERKKRLTPPTPRIFGGH